MAISGTSTASNGTATIKYRQYKHALNVFTTLVLLKTLLTRLKDAFIQHHKFLIEHNHISTIIFQFSISLSLIVFRIMLYQRFAIIYVEILIGIGISQLIFIFFKNVVSTNWEFYWKNIIRLFSYNKCSALLYCRNFQTKG